MKKYFSFMRIVFKEQFCNLTDLFGTMISFCIHILVFSALWDFVLEGKDVAGYTKQELIWYVIIAETIIYSFNNYYRKIAYKVEIGDFAYDMSKPYNFLARILSEGIAELPISVITLCIGIILGLILVGAIDISLIGLIGSLVIIILASVLLLMLNTVVGLSSIWLGRDVSSIWLLISKAMLIFAFSPLELLPNWLQAILIFLPTTHVIYTPASLFVNFTREKLVLSLTSELIAILFMGIVLTLIYRKGVKKQNVNGI